MARVRVTEPPFLMQPMSHFRISGFKEVEEISSAQVLADRLFVTLYMGTVNSSAETANRAKQLALEIGAYHFQIVVDPVVSALVALFVTVTGAVLTLEREDGHGPDSAITTQLMQEKLHSLRHMGVP